jgi:FAD/FMN-containing dehydrogenase
MATEVAGWGRYPISHSKVVPIRWRDERIPSGSGGELYLPIGLARSYGDSCLNDGQSLLSTLSMDRLIAFDPESGRLIAESGISFDAILRFAVPHGWFLPVTPGTRFVTLGGAVANDVHGKNHHCSGTFGDHVLRFDLVRSDGSRMICSPTENSDWFRATIGGLGLTGLIAWVEVQLKKVANSWIDAETVRCAGVDDFYDLSAESEPKFEYLVTWVDSLETRSVGKGLFMRGNHNSDPQRTERQMAKPPGLAVPFDLPFSLLNRMTLKAFNTLYYRAALLGPARKCAHFGSFFYPLDAIGRWNRLYGSAGLIQWQALLPIENRDVAREILSTVARSGSGSFLTVMKLMGEHRAAGLLSFSGRGITIALDFPYSDSLLPMLERLDGLVAEAGGRLYPAKDARMSGVHFRQFYPNWEKFLPYIDPRFSSSFWRRVMKD